MRRLDDWLYVLTILHSRLSKAGATTEIVIDLQNILHEVQKLRRGLEAVMQASSYVETERVRTICPTERWEHSIGRPRKQSTKEELSSLFEIHKCWVRVAEITGV